MQYTSYRRQTFEDGAPVGRSKTLQSWPNERPEIQHLADRGFFFSPTVKCHDQITCFGCGKKEHNVNEIDEISFHHLANSPNCALALIASSFCNYSDSLDPESYWASQKLPLLNDPLCLKSIEMRHSTFKNLWPHDGSRPASKSTSRNLAAAGFYYAPLHPDNDRVICMYCEFALENWDPSDDPLEEHRRSDKAYCYLLDKMDHPQKVPPRLQDSANDPVEGIPASDDGFDFNESEVDLSHENSPQPSDLLQEHAIETPEEETVHESSNDEKHANNSPNPPSPAPVNANLRLSPKKDIFDISLENLSDPDHTSFFAKKNTKKYVSKRRAQRMKQNVVKERVSSIIDSDQENDIPFATESTPVVSTVHNDSDASPIKTGIKSSKLQTASNGDDEIEKSEIETLKSPRTENEDPLGEKDAFSDAIAKEDHEEEISELEDTNTFGDTGHSTAYDPAEEDSDVSVKQPSSPPSMLVRRTRRTRTAPKTYEMELHESDLEEALSSGDDASFTDKSNANKSSQSKAKGRAKRKNAILKEEEVADVPPTASKKRKIRLSKPARSPAPDFFDISNQNLGDYGEDNINFLEDDINRAAPMASPQKKKTPPQPIKSSKIIKNLSIKKPTTVAKTSLKGRTPKSKSIFDVSSDDAIFGGKQDLSFEVTKTKAKDFGLPSANASKGPDKTETTSGPQNDTEKSRSSPGPLNDVLAEIASTDTPPPLPREGDGSIAEKEIQPALEEPEQETLQGIEPVVPEKTPLSSRATKTGPKPKSKDVSSKEGPTSKEKKVSSRLNARRNKLKSVSDTIGNNDVLDDPEDVIEKASLGIENGPGSRKKGVKRKNESSQTDHPGEQLIEATDSATPDSSQSKSKSRRVKKQAPEPDSDTTETALKPKLRKRRLRVVENQESGDDISEEPELQQKTPPKRRQLKRSTSEDSSEAKSIMPTLKGKKEIHNDHKSATKSSEELLADRSLEAKVSKYNSAKDEDQQDVSEQIDMSLVTSNGLPKSDKNPTDFEVSLDNVPKVSSVEVAENQLRTRHNGLEVGAVETAEIVDYSPIEVVSPKDDIPSINSSYHRQDTVKTSPHNKEPSGSAVDENTSGEHSPMPDFLPSNISGSTDIDFVFESASADPLSVPKEAPNDSAEESAHGETSGGPKPANLPADSSDVQLDNDSFISDEESPRKDVSLSPSSYTYYRQDLDAIRAEHVDLNTKETTDSTEKNEVAPVGKNVSGPFDGTSVSRNEFEVQGGNAGEQSIAEGKTVAGDKPSESREDQIVSSDAMRSQKGSLDIGGSERHVGPTEERDESTHEADRLLTGRKLLTGGIQEAIAKDTISQESASRDTNSTNSYKDKARSTSSRHNSARDVSVAETKEAARRANGLLSSNNSHISDPITSSESFAPRVRPPGGPPSSARSSLGRLSGTHSNILVSSTPQKKAYSVQSALSEDPLKPFEEELDTMKDAIQYLRGIANSKYDLYNDAEGELTRFIAELPEEEESMTIEEWVRHNAASCANTVMDMGERMIQVFEAECDRMIAAIEAMPEDDDEDEEGDEDQK